MLNQELFHKIRKVQIQTAHLADDVLAGAYRSAFKGKGMEFEEVREYIEGDEVRSIDWNVTARMDHPYVKTFREERELSVNLLVDTSASMRFGTLQRTKGDCLAEIAAVLAFSALKNHDKVSLIQFSDEVEHYYPPKKGERHILRLIRELLSHVPAGKGTNIEAALRFLGKVQTRFGIAFLLSDFLSADFSEYVAPLCKKFDLIAIAVYDPHERELPPMGVTTFIDEETGEEAVINTEDEAIRRSYQDSFDARMRSLRELMVRCGGSFIPICTADNYVHELQKFFRLREVQWH